MKKCLVVFAVARVIRCVVFWDEIEEVINRLNICTFDKPRVLCLRE